MADGTVHLPTDAGNTGPYTDTSSLTVGANTVHRQRNNIADPALAAAIQNVKPASTPAALTDMAAVVAVSPNSPVGKANFRDTAATLRVVKATPGTLFGLQIVNNQGAACYVQIFDAAAPVVGTDVPDMEIMVAANAFLSVPIPALGIAFGTAIRLVSTTLEKGSVGSAAGCHVFCQFA